MLMLVLTEHLILSGSLKMHNNKIKIIYHKEQIEISSATVFYRIATTQLDENVIFSLGSGGRGEGGGG